MKKSIVQLAFKVQTHFLADSSYPFRHYFEWRIIIFFFFFKNNPGLFLNFLPAVSVFRHMQKKKSWNWLRKLKTFFQVRTPELNMTMIQLRPMWTFLLRSLKFSSPFPRRFLSKSIPITKWSRYLKNCILFSNEKFIEKTCFVILGICLSFGEMYETRSLFF